MDKPIGVIDSGVGGLTVAQEIMRQLPKEEIVYFGDTARCPYGSRPWEEIRAYTWRMVDFVCAQDIKMLVIACNTATAVVLDDIQRILDIPVLGVIQPGARAALKETKNHRIAVIGTKGTIASGSYTHALQAINNQVEVEGLACPAFVPLVERGELLGEETRNAVRQSLAPLQGKGIDTLILGCTHYPLLKEAIGEVMGPDVAVISSGEETARETSTILYHSGLLNTHDTSPTHRFYTSGETLSFVLIANKWLQMNVSVESATLAKVPSLS